MDERHGRNANWAEENEIGGSLLANQQNSVHGVHLGFGVLFSKGFF